MMKVLATPHTKEGYGLGKEGWDGREGCNLKA